jgi:phosphate transport system permease protein
MRPALQDLPASTDRSEAPSAFDPRARRRRRIGWGMQLVFLLSTLVGILALAALMYNIINGAIGLRAVEYKNDPASLAVDGVPVEDLTQEQLLLVLQENLSRGAINKLNTESPLEQRSQEQLYGVIVERLLKPKVVESWTLVDSLTRRGEIEAFVAQEAPAARLEFVSWITPDFVSQPQSSEPLRAGVRSAIKGSLLTILITIVVAFPVGVAAAIYLEEYARDNLVNRIIRTNINNLAGVPSIIYGMLGLVIFVRVLEPMTSGALFGLVEDPTTANGRTVLAAGMTLALLVLPLVIINAQEAVRAVPDSLRQAGFGLGGTKWQTIWSHVLPTALPGILTGTILAISRAFGETAPLVVIGASTYISSDPSGPFSKFTALPIQIYQWTARPQSEFRNLAAASIIVLLILLLALNATAVLLRNRYGRQAELL